MRHKPSKYQQDIYNALVTTNKNIAISATAGSGKTFCLVEAAKLVPYGKRTAFVAFNKHIVRELKNRLPVGVECFTMHSLGFSFIRQHYNSVILNPKKQLKFIEPLFKDEVDQRKKWKKIYAVDKMMHLARATMTKPTKEDLDVLIGKYALDAEPEEIMGTIKAMRKFQSYNEDTKPYDEMIIDFTDMVGVCVHQDISISKYDYLFLDEGQDFSVQDRMFIAKLIKPITGRKIICGDGRQSLYSFRGADIYSFDNFVKEPNTIQMPLTVSYRCAKAIVREAKKIYPEIEEWPESEEGIVRKGKIEEIGEEDMVICRNTLPLIEVFLSLISNDKKAYIVGKEMEQGLLGMLASIDSSAGTDAWMEFKEREKEKVINKLKNKGVKNPLKHPQYGIFNEKIQILSLLFDKFQYVYQIEEFVKEMFEYDEEEYREGTKLITVHKSKGLECNRVFFIIEHDGKKLIPSQYAVTEEMLMVEENIRFVGTTRAKKELIYLHL